MPVLLILRTHTAETKGPLQLGNHEQSYKNAANTAHESDSEKERERGDGGAMYVSACECVSVCMCVWWLCVYVCVCYRQTADHSLKNVFNIRH